MIAAPNATPRAQALIRGYNRAVDEKLVVYRVDAGLMGVASVAGGIWAEKPYRITVTGPRAQDVTCECIAAKRGLCCKHRSLAVYCRRHNVYAIQGTAKPAIRLVPTSTATVAPAPAGAPAGAPVWRSIPVATPLDEMFA